MVPHFNIFNSGLSLLIYQHDSFAFTYEKKNACGLFHKYILLLYIQTKCKTSTKNFR